MKNELELIRMAKIEAAQSLLAPVVLQCMTSLGAPETYEALEWVKDIVKMTRDKGLSEEIEQ